MGNKVEWRYLDKPRNLTSKPNLFQEWSPVMMMILVNWRWRWFRREGERLGSCLMLLSENVRMKDNGNRRVYLET